MVAGSSSLPLTGVIPSQRCHVQSQGLNRTWSGRHSLPTEYHPALGAVLLEQRKVFKRQVVWTHVTGYIFDSSDTAHQGTSPSNLFPLPEQGT